MEAVDDFTWPDKADFFTDDSLQKAIISFQPGNTLSECLILTQQDKDLRLNAFLFGRQTLQVEDSSVTKHGGEHQQGIQRHCGREPQFTHREVTMHDSYCTDGRAPKQLFGKRGAGHREGSGV